MKIPSREILLYRGIIEGNLTDKMDEVINNSMGNYVFFKNIGRSQYSIRDSIRDIDFKIKETLKDIVND